MNGLMDKVELKVAFCSYEAAKYACQNYHYSKTIPASKLVKIGVWENEEFIGAVIFGLGANNNLGKPYGLPSLECCELVRVALKEHQSPVTQIVSRSINLLKNHCVGLKLIISYADTAQNHLGVIYQAGNWIYVGRMKQPTEYILKGKRMHGRTLSSMGGVKKYPEARAVKGSSKHKYLYPLDKKTRKQISRLSLPYPKKDDAKQTERVDTTVPLDKPIHFTNS